MKGFKSKPNYNGTLVLTADEAMRSKVTTYLRLACSDSVDSCRHDKLNTQLEIKNTIEEKVIWYQLELGK